MGQPRKNSKRSLDGVSHWRTCSRRNLKGPSWPELVVVVVFFHYSPKKAQGSCKWSKQAMGLARRELVLFSFSHPHTHRKRSPIRRHFPQKVSLIPPERPRGCERRIDFQGACGGFLCGGATDPSRHWNSSQWK